MNAKEKLAELIIQAIDTYATMPLVNGCRPELKYFLADHLLADGVLCPPCKVGDTVYVISESRVKEAEIDEILRSRNDAKIFVAFECGEDDCASCPFNAWQRSCCGEWDCDNAYGSAELAEEEFGKTVFLSRDLAEKALAERSNK